MFLVTIFYLSDISFLGIPLWVIGGNRKTKVELTLQKFDFAKNNSMALGVGVTLRF